jgi:DNA-binding MarR family transcriptional regulator
MNTKNLTKKEQNTLWSLINYPTLHDQALAKKSRVKLSTVTAIRRRLTEKGYFRIVNIPNFFRIGFELFIVEYGTFNEAVPLENRVEYFRDFVNRDPNVVFSLLSRSSGLLVRVAENYASATQQYEDMVMFLASHHLIDERSWSRVMFPFQTSQFWNFFNYSPIIRYTYNIKRKTNLRDFIPDKNVISVKLSKKEKKVLLGLVRYPDEPDNNIADMVNMSRQAVSTIRKRFERDDLLTRQRIMNLKYTKCNLVTFSYTYFGSKTPLHARRKGITYVKEAAPVFVGISSNFENVLLSATADYNEYERIKENLLSFYKSHMSMSQPPFVMLFPVDDLLYTKDLNFYDLLDRGLEKI